MSDILERLKLRARREVELPSGLKVAYHLPDVTECILAGDLPLPVLDRMSKTANNGEVAVSSLSTEDIRSSHRFKRLVVATMLDEVDGETVPDEDREAIAAALDPADHEELFRIATRQKGPGPTSGEA